MNTDDPFYQLALALAKALGVTPLTIVGFLPILVMLANFVSKLIPDDATGWRAWVRKVAAFIGLAYANRVTSNLTTADVAAMFLRTKGIPVSPEKIDEVSNKVEALGVPSESVLAPPPPPLFPGVGRDPTNGQFTKIGSPMIVGLVAMLLAVFMLSGCVTARTHAQTYACNNQATIQLGAQIARLKAMQIADLTQRQAALAAIDVGLMAALANCPTTPATQPVSE
jgi:hypothetical protein